MIRITIDSDSRCEGKTALAGLLNSFLSKMGYKVDIDAPNYTKEVIAENYDALPWSEFRPRAVTIVDRA